MINHIPELIRKTVCGFYDKELSLFKTNTPRDYDKQTVYGRGKRPSKPKTHKKKNLKKT